MEKEKNIQTVQQLYADFGKQDLEGVLDSLTDDVAWNDGSHPDIPYTKKRNGKNEVMSFFMELGSTVAFTEFAPQEFYADNDTVIVKGSFAGKATGTGKSFASEWVQIWKFRGDKIFSFQAFVNTAAIIAAIK
jgi:ketosteroid isomerase-like protein